MKRLIKNNKGFTLIELIIAICLLTISTTMFVSAMITSGKITEMSAEENVAREDAVGRMDAKFSDSSATGEDVTITVVFPDAVGTENVDCYKVTDDSSDYYIGVIKPK